IIRAYLLAFASTAGPRIVGLILALLPHKNSQNARQQLTIKLWRALKQSAAWNSFPAFCACLVGASLVTQIPLRPLHHSDWIPSSQRRNLQLATTFISASIAANIGFNLLNSQPSASSQDGSAAPKSKGTLQSGNLRASSPSLQPLAGHTIDLTLFAVVRALDVLIAPVVAKRRSKTARIVSRSSPTVLFVLSCFIIMRAWFYAPARLPRSYNRWISSAAQLDPRLLLALRHARYGHFRYGVETGIGPLLGSMARDYGLPEVWGNPAKTIPVPCELVHQGVGPSCELHFGHRFAKAWFFAAKMYVPLQLLVWTQRYVLSSRHAAAVRLAALVKAIREGARSSAFLAAFVSLFYYGVCLGRTRLGPLLFSAKTVSPQMWDSGLAVSVGAWLCGWAVLLEKPARRAEFAFFVLPRALAVVLPRRYERKHLGRERAAFVLAAAVLMTAAQQCPQRVRGVFGGVLAGVL
ncbi:uncharacterized protein BKA78DRAFT_232525, partial [Phyllosticta capitalensis]|uniref:uncharacterized protein n=1 Tax=Phyllosticta capitalensis TaxID=121624 RepID=UPI00312F0FD5